MDSPSFLVIPILSAIIWLEDSNHKEKAKKQIQGQEHYHD